MSASVLFLARGRDPSLGPRHVLTMVMIPGDLDQTSYLAAQAVLDQAAAAHPPQARAQAGDTR
jgi:hypothetical protein